MFAKLSSCCGQQAVLLVSRLPLFIFLTVALGFSAHFIRLARYKIAPPLAVSLAANVTGLVLSVIVKGLLLHHGVESRYMLVLDAISAGLLIAASGYLTWVAACHPTYHIGRYSGRVYTELSTECQKQRALQAFLFVSWIWLLLGASMEVCYPLRSRSTPSSINPPNDSAVPETAEESIAPKQSATENIES